MINQQYLQFIQGQLARFAAQDNFESIIFTAFGDQVDLLLLQDLRQQWLMGDFRVIPEIQVVENGELGEAKGAYAAELDRIFVSTDFLATASASSIGAVLLEEVGHRIDRLLNHGLDSVGDEGELFSALVRGVSLTAAQIAVIQAENDHTTAIISGQVVEIETASFSSPSTFAVGATPFSIAVGDFNGDGKQDLTTANYNDTNISVLLGNGNGNFTNSIAFAVGSGTSSITVGDFNGDGKQDLVTTNRAFGNNKVSVLLGNGIGGFTNPTTFAVGEMPRSVTVGDFNGDGKQDLATANFISNNVSILLGNGNGSFTNSAVFAVGENPTFITVGDFNNDGKKDLATTNFGSNSVSILLGNGYGYFANQATFAVGSNPSSVTVGDFNGDGKQDLAVAISNDSSISVLLGNGIGSFTNSSTLAVSGSPQSVTVGDFNGDGKQDLAAASSISHRASILLGNGNGNFTNSSTLAVGSGSLSITVGDFNGDGKQDLAAVSFGNNVSVLLNTSPVITISPGITPQEQGSNGIAPFNPLLPPPIIGGLPPLTPPLPLLPSQLPPSDGSFTISLDTPAPSGGLVVNFTLAGGTATFGIDYTLAPGVGITAVTNNSFSIAGGATTATLIVSPINDGVPDPNETIQITLQSGDDYILGALPQAVLSIIDSTGNTENHAPTLDFVVPIDYVDTTLNDLFTPTTGVLIGLDPDVNTTLAYGLAGGTVTGTTSNLTGIYGTVSLNNLTGAYTYTPNATAINAVSANSNPTDDFTFMVSDGSLSAQQLFAVNIFGSNDNPTSATAIANQSATEEAPFSFTIPAGTFTDIDTNDSLSFTATLSNNSPLPAWLNFDISTGIFSGIPTNSDVGAINVKVTAVDTSGALVSSEFNLVVTNINNAPTVAIAISDRTTAEDAPFSFTIPLNTFADADTGDTLTLTATLSDGSLLPNWLTFNANTREFHGTPMNGDVGTISVRVTATDAVNTSISDEFDLVITNTNDAPTLATAIADLSTAENTPFSFTIPLETFADIDADDTLTLSASLANGQPLPSWLTFNTNTGTFSGTPTNSDVRTISVKVTATDSSNTFVSDEFNLTVVDNTPPPAPLITGISNDTGVSNTDRITSDTTLVLSGTAEANSTVQLFRANASIGTATTNASGNWSFDYTGTTLSNGTYNFTATAADAAGNISLLSAPLSVTVDNTAPNQIATITGMSPDPGTSSTDFLTNDGTTARTYSGGLSAPLLSDEILQISVNGGTTWSNAVASGATWTFVDNSTQSSDWTIQARVIDLAGNAGLIVSKAVTLDQQISAANAIALDLIATSDSGISNTDNTTNIATPTFAVTFDSTKAQTGDILEIRNGTAVLGTVTLTAAQVSAGTANIALTTALINGLNTLSAVHRDRAGNSSTGINTLGVTFDQQISAANAVTLDLLATSDSGSSQIDNITNITAPTIAIAFDPTKAQTGDTLEIRKGITVLGTATLTAVQVIAGTANITLTTALTSGINTLTAIHRDVAGNTVTGSAALAVTLDITAPTTPVITSMSPDPGSSSTDFLTNDGTTARTYNGTLSTVSGAAGVQVSVDGGANWSNATVSGTAWTFLDNSAQISNWTIQARAVDLAGNVSLIASKIVTLDRQISAANAITLDLFATSDSGVSNTDNITRIQTPTFAVTFDTTKAQVGDILEIRNGSAILGTATLTTTQAVAGSANITLNTVLANGINTLSAVHRDRAGNSSTSANTLNVTFDQQISAASAVVLDLLATSDSGASQVDNITNATTPTFALTFDATKAVAGDILELRKGSVVLGTATLDVAQASAGIVNLTLATVLTNGSNILSAVHRDLAGNTATSAALAVISDTTGPTAPTVLGYSATSVTGTAEANATILFSTSSSSPSSFATTATTNNSNYAISTSSLIGSNVGQSYYLYARDIAGNLSLASSQRVVVAAAGNNTLSNVGSTGSDLLVGNAGTFQTIEYAVSGNAISLTGQLTAANVTSKSVNIKNANIDVLSSIEQLNFTGSGYSLIAANAPGLNQLRGQVQVNPAALVNNSISAFTGAYDASSGTFSIGSATPNATLVAFDSNSGSSQNYEAFLVLDKTSIGGSIGLNSGILSLTI
jgi:Bacterial Ig-like domain/Putative Ig domain/FG-GAP-like repeat/FG-GAP repeat